MLVRDERERGLRRYDRMVTAGMREGSILSYQRAVAAFLIWLSFQGIEPQEAFEYDDPTVEYKSFGGEGGGPVGKSHYEKLLSGVEKVLPHFRGDLLLARATLSAWQISFGPKHAVPLSRPYAVLLASSLLGQGYHRGVIHCLRRHAPRDGRR